MNLKKSPTLVLKYRAPTRTFGRPDGEMMSPERFIVRSVQNSEIPITVLPGDKLDRATVEELAKDGYSISLEDT